MGSAVRYVVVVHGMGESRKNESVLDVVSRFAEARSLNGWPPPDDVLTLGRASSLTGLDPRTGVCRLPAVGSTALPWMEFEGISDDPASRSEEPFLGLSNDDPDELNLRFVDLHWADLLEEDYEGVGQDPNAWTSGLLGRLVRRHEAARRMGMEPPPRWPIRILEVLRETIALVHGFTRLRAAEFDDLVFGKYLGDVQVYAEFAHCRGRAVRRFHEAIRRVEAEHDAREKRRVEAAKKAKLGGVVERPARYSIIAHSLGTVMSLDALMFAHAPLEVRTGQRPVPPNLPFPGYCDSPRPSPDPAYLSTDWIRRVDSFVTLGSPIDKFLFIWWLNYAYLTDASWIDDSLARPPERGGERILHFNYCDEQDPVGHRLDLARRMPAFSRVFDTREDVAHVRYVVPGLAHVKYWKDLPLFSWILSRAVDLRQDAADPPAWFDRRIYGRVLTLMYTVVPYAIFLTLGFLASWAWTTDSTHTAVLLGAGLFAASRLGRYLIDLVFWWRQLLRAKGMEAGLTMGQTGTDLKRLVTPAPSPPAVGPKDGASYYLQAKEHWEDQVKEHDEGRFRGWLLVTALFGAVVAGLLVGTLVDDVLRRKAWSELGIARIALVLGTAAVCNFVWSRLYQPQRSLERENL